MDFKSTNVRFYKHPPNNTIVDDVLAAYRVNLNEMKEALENYDFTRRKTYQGFQIELGKQLRDLLRNLFKENGWYVYTQARKVKYSPRIDLRADLVVKAPTNGKGIYIEIEFRPNEYNDIVKFELGHNNRLTELGILAVAQNRDHINPGYTTMPEFDKCRNIIIELQPQCPILLIGIDGENL